MKVTVILEPEEDGAYSVICPALPGCCSQGESLEDAMVNIREAILLCLEDGSMPHPEVPGLVDKEIRECLKDREEEALPSTVETREIDMEAVEATSGGFEISRPGCHHTLMRKGDLVLTVPLVDELKPGMLRALIRQAGLTVEEFVELLR